MSLYNETAFYGRVLSRVISGYSDLPLVWINLTVLSQSWHPDTNVWHSDFMESEGCSPHANFLSVLSELVVFSLADLELLSWSPTVSLASTVVSGSEIAGRLLSCVVPLLGVTLSVTLSVTLAVTLDVTVTLPIGANPSLMSSSV